MATKALAKVRFFSEQLMVELGQKLVADKKITRPQLEELMSRKALTGESVDILLIRESLVPEIDILKVLSDLTAIPYKPVMEFSVDADAVGRVPAKAALRYHIMPLDLQKGKLTLAVSRVPTLSMVDSVRMLLGLALEWVLCAESDISKSLKHFYGLGAATVGDLIEEKADDIDNLALQETDLAVESGADEGVVKFVNQIIHEAIQMEATDIHIEPFEGRLRLRYRIDGILQEIAIPEGIQHLQKAIASCVKIMAELNIAERRMPHDGRIKVRRGQDEFDLRVSVLPTRFGETVNMRILNRSAMFIEMPGLGLEGKQLPILNDLAALPHGVVLITGPTGSGKTTTLYALLGKLNSREVKIITVEDPIEYQMVGINQIQVHSQIGLSFASILRSILRHDPDIILIGEVRDMETADIAVRASLTGHLVLSTLHTNDAPSAITRMIDMGVEPYLVSSCLEGVVAQRLVRRVCASCQEVMVPDDAIMNEIAETFPDDRLEDANFLKGKGCPDCNFTGYKGRIAIFEIMIMDDLLRGMVVHQKPSNEIKKKAMQHGMVTLRQEGWRRALDGMTSIEEVLRVAHKSELMSFV